MDAELSAVLNTPLLVNLLRLIRNCRLPRIDSDNDDEYVDPFVSCDRPQLASATSSFDFGGLRMTDLRPFKGAEAVWATLSAGGGDDARRDELGSTFAGPLHLLVALDGATVEHWTLEDYREEHTENSVPRGIDQSASLDGMVRILFTYLCTQEVYGVIADKESAALLESVTRSRPRSCAYSDGSSASSDREAAADPDVACTVSSAGVQLHVFGDDGSGGASEFARRGLLSLHRDGASATRYKARHWYVEGLVRVSVVTDTQWRRAAAAAAVARKTPTPIQVPSAAPVPQPSAPTPGDSHSARASAIAGAAARVVSPPPDLLPNPLREPLPAHIRRQGLVFGDLAAQMAEESAAAPPGSAPELFELCTLLSKDAMPTAHLGELLLALRL